MLGALALGVLTLVGGAAAAAVDVTAPPPQVIPQGDVTRTIQKVTFANELAYYALTYDYQTEAAKPSEASSTWWGWTAGFVPIGMTDPSGCNWYWQAFFTWEFDDENLANRPATFRVVRSSGTDGMVEFAWDTPKVRAVIRFAMVTGNDKLLMFGHYEPKVAVQRARLRFSSYPGGFDLPRNRAVTTASGTATVGQTVQLNLDRERWFLLEDVTPDNPRQGPAGMVIGTPESFAGVTIPVGEYGIVPILELKPEARSFALALYDFPSLPDYRQARRYFAASADREAMVLGQIAHGDLDRPLPAIQVDQSRFAGLREREEKLFGRGTEIWRPDPVPLSFDWSRRLPAGPIRTTLFAVRYAAWETMELGRRLDLSVRHLYWDNSQAISQADHWPYAGTTGQGPLPPYATSRRALELASDPETELFLVAGVSADGLPGNARNEMLQRVAAGKGLLLVDRPGRLASWPAELFSTPDAAATADALAGLDWQHIPGFSAETPPVTVYRYGEGRVVVLRVDATVYGCLVPANNERDGLWSITDHALAVAARCAALAAGRAPAVRVELQAPPGDSTPQVRFGPEPPAGSTVLVRVMDDLDTVVDEHKHRWPLEGALKLPHLPALRRHWVDVQVRDDQGSTLGFGFVQVPAGAEPALGPVALSPAIQAEGVLIPRVDLPDGGSVAAEVQVSGLDEAAEMVWEVSDALGRRVARAVEPVPAGGGPVRADLKLPRPVTVCHQLDLTLRRAGRLLARTRQHFTVTVPYPYDDFTALMWSYAGGDPVLRVTDRKCYEWGADMMDLCHVGGFADEKAAREFWLSARSGLRLVPYVTRLAGTANGSGAVPREPCLHDPAYLDPTRTALVASCRQAEPFCPAAYTLGDENYLYDGSGEPCNTLYTMAAFREWLQKKYGTITDLNEAWATDLRDFADIAQPMVLAEALQQTESFAAWLDHRLFMDTAFAATHELFMDTIRTVDSDARVGWDGFLGWSPRSGYDFRQLTANLQLNQTYTTEWLQGEMVRCFKRPDALTGKWGNSVADVEAGWHAFPWDCLLAGDNSVWWWTSWGCDYIPFNPDTSQSSFGKWFFEAVRETTSGPGKLLLQAERVDSGVAVLHAQRNLFAGQLLAKLDGEASRAGTGDTGYLNELTVLLRGLRDYGLQSRVIAPDQLSGPESVLDGCKVLFAPLAVCLSDTEAAAIREFVRRGGTLVVDGRCGVLDGNGRVRQQRALDDVLGLEGPTGRQCMAAPSPPVATGLSASLDGAAQTVGLEIEKLEGRVLEAAVVATTAKSLVGDQPLLLVNHFGRGVALTLNLDMSEGHTDAAPLGVLDRERVETGLQPCEAILGAVLRSAGVLPFCDLKTPSGERPLCVQQVLYRDGDNAYLALMRDILVRGLPAEQFQVTLAEPAYVYDLRAGKLLGPGRQSRWSVRLDRGYPAVYALLPYRVAELEAFAPGQAKPGDTVGVRARIVPLDGTAGTHVFRLDVCPPGADTPHRQYSQNILAERGQGRAEIPFALNDPQGSWRLVFRDVATGTVTTRLLELQ